MASSNSAQIIDASLKNNIDEATDILKKTLAEYTVISRRLSETNVQHAKILKDYKSMFLNETEFNESLFQIQQDMFNTQLDSMREMFNSYQDGIHSGAVTLDQIKNELTTSKQLNIDDLIDEHVKLIDSINNSIPGSADYVELITQLEFNKEQQKSVSDYIKNIVSSNTVDGLLSNEKNAIRNDTFSTLYNEVKDDLYSKFNDFSKNLSQEIAENMLSLDDKRNELSTEKETAHKAKSSGKHVNTIDLLKNDLQIHFLDENIALQKQLQLATANKDSSLINELLSKIVENTDAEVFYLKKLENTKQTVQEQIQNLNDNMIEHFTENISSVVTNFSNQVATVLSGNAKIYEEIGLQFNHITPAFNADSFQSKQQDSIKKLKEKLSGNDDDSPPTKKSIRNLFEQFNETQSLFIEKFATSQQVLTNSKEPINSVLTNGFSGVVNSISHVVSTSTAGLSQIGSSIVSGIGRSLTGLASSFLPMIGNLLSTVLGPVTGGLSILLSLLMEVVQPLIEFVMDTIMNLWTTIKESIINLIMPVVELIMNVISAVLTPLLSIVKLLMTVIQVFLIPLQIISKVIGFVGETIGIIFDVILLPLNVIMDGILEILNIIFSVALLPIKILLSLMKIPLDIIKNVTEIIGKILGWVMGPIMSFMGLIFEIIEATIQPIFEAIGYKLLSVMMPVFQTLLDVILPMFLDLATELDKLFSDPEFIKGFQTLIINVTQWLLGLMKSLVSGAGGSGSISGWILKIVGKTILSLMLALPKLIFGAIWSVISLTITFIWDLVKGLFFTIGEAVSWIFDSVMSLFKNILSLPKAIFSFMFDLVESLFSRAMSIFSKIWSGITWIFNTVTAHFSAIFSAVSKIAGIVWSVINEIFSLPSKVIGWITTGIKTFWNAILGVTGWIWTFLKSIGKALSSAFDAVLELPGKIVNWIFDLFKSIWNGIIEGVAWLASSIPIVGSSLGESVRSMKIGENESASNSGTIVESTHVNTPTDVSTQPALLSETTSNQFGDAIGRICSSLEMLLSYYENDAEEIKQTLTEINVNSKDLNSNTTDFFKSKKISDATFKTQLFKLLSEAANKSNNRTIPAPFQTVDNFNLSYGRT